jgi:hypothetical protein
MMKKLLLAAIMAVGLNSYALAQATFTAKDAAGSTQAFKSFNCSANICSLSVPADTTGAAFGVTANPIFVAPGTGQTFPISGTITSNVGTGTRAISAASGAFASGALASGSVASGAMVDLGSQADAACGTATGSCSLIALQKFNNTATTSPLAAGTAIIGKVGFDQTTPGTTNSVSFGTDPCTFLAKTNFTGSQTAGTQIIAGTSSKKTYICSMQLIAQAAEIVNIVAGTGTVCATGTSAVMGSTTAANGLSYAANGGFANGNGTGTIILASNAAADNICITQNGSSRITYQGTYVQN